MISCREDVFYTTSQGMDILNNIARQIASCTACPLSQNRTHPVPGEGPDQSEVIFIGEAPGFNEDQQGRPFVGPAGRVLETLLDSIGLKRSDIFITNVVKCRPHNNRDPRPEEIASCRKYLNAQIDAISPKVIVPLGRHAMANFITDTTISKARGKSTILNGLTVFPIYHPAAALHQPKLRAALEEDIKKLSDLLQNQPSATLTPAKGEQLPMF